MASLQEVREQWTLDDLLDFHELMDARERALAQTLPKTGGARRG